MLNLVSLLFDDRHFLKVYLNSVSSLLAIIKTARRSVTEALSVTGWPMHGKQT